MRKHQRLISVGCSHGAYINKACERAVLRFIDRWKPEIRIHLGDCYDCTFLMRSKLKSGDSERPGADIKAGQDFLRRFSPTTFCIGNHEQRALDLCNSNHAIVAEAAARMKEDMFAPINKKTCNIVPYTIHEEGWFHVGNYRFGHGHLYGQNFLVETANAFGRAVVAHAHRPGVANGRRSDNPTAYCVGTMADIPLMEYANRATSTLSWGYGLVFGETDGETTHLSLWQWPQGTTDFRLPI